MNPLKEHSAQNIINILNTKYNISLTESKKVNWNESGYTKSFDKITKISFFGLGLDSVPREVFFN